MKQCPTCKTTYTDDSLRFCLADGGILAEVADEGAATRERTAILVDIDKGDPVSTSVPLPQPSTSGGKKIFTIVAVLIGIAVLVLAGIGIAGFAYYYSGQSVATESTTPQPTATIDPEKARLEKELAELQKQIAKTTPTPSPTPFPDNRDIDEGDGYVRGRVNSPGDGFLALRTAPDAEKGARITQIPHGSIVTIEDCEQQTKTIGGRVGRWCMVTFRGETGWVFDAWLDQVKQ